LRLKSILTRSCDEDSALANRVCRNGPQVPVKVDELVTEAHQIWTAEGKPKAVGTRLETARRMDRKVKVIVWCGNVRACPSEEAANNGGSGPTEEAAYRALLLSVKHEEDRETEAECEPLSAEDLRDKNAWAKAEHANEKAEGA